MIEQANTMGALAAAKELHTLHASGQSETVLREAYAARAWTLGKKGLHEEARALLELAADRMPECADGFREMRRTQDIAAGRLHDVIPLLQDETTCEEGYALLRRHLIDVESLARTDLLAPDHPLRTAAAQVHEAWTHVTTGAVTDDQIRMPAVSHRSPLAPWKALIRALAFLYRNDDDACARALAAVDPASAPARAVPAVRAIVQSGAGDALSPAVGALVDCVTGHRRTVTTLLQDIDAAIAGGDSGQILAALRRAQAALDRCRPDLVPQLAVRACCHKSLSAIKPEEITAAVGQKGSSEPAVLRSLARVAPEPIEACRRWDAFRRSAIAYRWFDADSLEHAAVCLHMADLLNAIEDEELEWAHRRFAGLKVRPIEGEPPEAHADGIPANRRFLHPMSLYRTACAIDPAPANFQAWLAWASSSRHRKKLAAEVAQLWQKACPRDSRPVLHLYEAAWRRSALRQAMKYLDEAERRDGLNPQVREARVRLLIDTLVRHLRQRKPHLARQDLERLAEVEMPRREQRRVLIAALEWVCARLENARDDALSTCRERVAVLAGDPLAGEVVLWSVAASCRAPLSGKFAAPLAYGTVARAVAAAAGITADLDGTELMRAQWHATLIAEVSDESIALSCSELLALGRAAVQHERLKLAYAVCARGLTAHHDAAAHFLLLRAQSLGPPAIERRLGCLAAAFTLAHRKGDDRLLAQVGEVMRTLDVRRFMSSCNIRPNQILEDEPLARVLALERSGRLDQYEDWCLCPDCMRELGHDPYKDGKDARAARSMPSPLEGGARGEPCEDDWDDDEDEEPDDDLDLLDVAEAIGVVTENLPALVQWLCAASEHLTPERVLELLATFPPDLVHAALAVFQHYDGELPDHSVLRTEDPKSFDILTRALTHLARAALRELPLDDLHLPPKFRASRARKRGGPRRGPRRPNLSIDDLPLEPDELW